MSDALRRRGRLFVAAGSLFHLALSLLIAFGTFPAGDALGILLSVFGLWGVFLGGVALRYSFQGRWREAAKTAMVSAWCPPVNVLTFWGARLLRAAQ